MTGHPCCSLLNEQFFRKESPDGRKAKEDNSFTASTHCSKFIPTVSLNLKTLLLRIQIRRNSRTRLRRTPRTYHKPPLSLTLKDHCVGQGCGNTNPSTPSTRNEKPLVFEITRTLALQLQCTQAQPQRSPQCPERRH